MWAVWPAVIWDFSWTTGPESVGGTLHVRLTDSGGTLHVRLTDSGGTLHV